MQKHEDTPYRVFNMPKPLLQSWNRSELYLNEAETVLHPDRLIKLRDAVTGRPRIAMERLVEWGISVDTEDRKYRQLLQLKEMSLKKTKRGKEKDLTSQGSAMESFRKATAPETIREMQSELLKAQKMREDLTEDDDGHIMTDVHQPVPMSTVNEDDSRIALLASSPIVDVKIGQSASSKLNFILNEVRLLPNFKRLSDPMDRFCAILLLRSS